MDIDSGKLIARLREQRDKTSALLAERVRSHNAEMAALHASIHQVDEAIETVEALVEEAQDAMTPKPKPTPMFREDIRVHRGTAV